MSDTTFVYILCHEKNGRKVRPCKIGVSNNQKKRASSLSSGNPHKIILYHKFGIPDKELAYGLKKAMLKVLFEHSMQGEWFDLSPESMFNHMHKNLKACLAWAGFTGVELIKHLSYSTFVSGGGYGGGGKTCE